MSSKFVEKKIFLLLAPTFIVALSHIISFITIDGPQGTIFIEIAAYIAVAGVIVGLINSFVWLLKKEYMKAFCSVLGVIIAFVFWFVSSIIIVNYIGLGFT